ncbi:hypothetical protein ACYSNX_08170 [Myroides sp. LJL115]
MKSSEMFCLTKVVLQRVSFDPHLFHKELSKATHYLLPHELENLYTWVVQFVEGKPELQPSLVLLAN